MKIPAVNKAKVVVGGLAFLILGLVLLLVRESEGKVAAETKLNDLKFRMESATNQNESLISELKNTIHDLEQKISDLNAKHESEMTAKASEVQDRDAKIEEAGRRLEALKSDKDAEIADTEAKAKTQAEHLNGMIREKSAKMQELGNELEKASARYAELLKEKEAVEAHAISVEADVSGLRRDLKKVEREKERLNEAIQALTKKPAVEPAHD